RTAPDGSTLHYEHDAAGRITRITAQKADGETDGITELAYDVAGRLTKAASPDAVVEYAYNRAGQVTSETVNGEAVQSGYDAGGQRAVVEGVLAPLQLAWQSGRLSSLGIGSHQPLQFSHTAAGEEQRRSNGSGFSLRHEWSPTGLLQRQALEGADGRVNDVLERRYQYDVLDRLTGISDSHWGEQAFRLNGAGQVTAERRDEGRRRQARLFGYDSEQNLCEVSQIAPGLGETLKVQDAVVQASARYDAAGRVVERGHTQYRYDDCGRLAVKRETRPGFRPKETYFDWDVQDRLVRVSLPDGARWRYRYDAFGRRVSKVREGQVPSAQAVARVAYRWDGDQLIGQQQYRADGSAAREVQWVYEPGSFRPLAQVEAQGESTQLHYIITDLTGTARELCSEEEEVRWRGEQGLWGAHREELRPIPLRRYQGQLFDAETGLYYNRHRYYDAESGQYLSPDPIGLLGGRRPQGYVHNPLEWVDPFGLTPKQDAKMGPHGTLKKDPSPGQSHHLNQDAAYRDVIPREKGAAIKLEGNAFTEPGTPHYEAHSSMEKFWDQYRRGGELNGQFPTNTKYTQALKRSLEAAGLPSNQVNQAVKYSIQNRVQHGALGGMEVPRIPGRINQVK
ncbi:RHS repeat-associated core domain-containing protein, partial [Pectobacterium brasiliense]|uniref:RHS repeat-associated core domain-containing protein n=1 Tax=Pectobacterium brasiliense TaxID=180957 RepID=UPI001F086A60